MCKCVQYYCHRVTTQMQLTNISYQNSTCFGEIFCPSSGVISKIVKLYINREFYYIGRTCCIFWNIFTILTFHITHHFTYNMFYNLTTMYMYFSTQVRGFKPGRNHWIFKGEKVLSAPSFGGEVKPSVPCRRFAACKRFLMV